MSRRDILGLKQPWHVHNTIRDIQRARLMRWRSSFFHYFFSAVPVLCKIWLKLFAVQLTNEYRTIRKRMRYRGDFLGNN